MLRGYLLAIKDINPSDKEHTYRTSLHNLLSNIIESLRGGANITITHEPNNSKEGFGAPDFLIRKDSLVLGYIENKRINTSLDEVAKGKQIEKYFHLSNHIILTDYLRFCLLCKNEKGEIIVANELRICEYDELKAIIKDRAFIAGKQKELLDFFSLFLSKNPNSINNAKDFADALALRTKILKDELLANEDSRHISGLYNTFREVLYKELSFEDFCDSFAQTLTYSLFLSRLNNNTNESITLVNAKQFIPKSFPLIRAMSGFLEELDELDSIKWLIGEIIGIINHIDIVEMIKELNKISQKESFGDSLHKDPYLHFYETFLCSYDRALREVRGVYYTPLPVVRFIIESIDFILRNDFGKNDGLANALSDETITLLDFATGTGTFLLEAFRKALGDIPQNSPKYNPKALIHRFYGFEFLIAPYTIAHLKLSQSFKEEFCAELGDKESLNIALTNTLYFNKENDEVNKNYNLYGGLIDLNEEFLKAQSLKEKEILIITGNPPYNANSINSYDIESYKFCQIDTLGQKIPINEKKHRLSDDYIKFLRFAQNKIDKQETGIVAVITNNSFLDAVTMRGMRWSLLNSFNKIFLLNLHGDNNKQEINPNGGKDENVFDIMQGVSISVFVKTRYNKLLSNTPQCDVFYYDCYGKRQEKYNFLFANTLTSIQWKKIIPQPPFYELFPQNTTAKNEYKNFVSIREIFGVAGLGICTYRDDLCYANSYDEMKDRICKFVNLGDAEIIKYFNLPDDTSGWTLKSAKQDVINTKQDSNLIRKVHFKPFDFKYTYYTGKSKGFHGRPAYAIQQYMLQKNIALVCYRSCNTKGLDNVFVVNHMIDLHLVGSGSSLFPLYLYDELHPNKKEENFTTAFRNFIDTKYGEVFTPEEILGYIYAILFHKNYREKYLDFLKIDFPKIPFVDSKEAFMGFSTLGVKLIALHLLRDSSLDSSVGVPLYKDERNDKIEKITYIASEKRLFVNPSLHFNNVVQNVWEYKIGGYNVLDKYLKSHKGEEIYWEHFQKIIQTLHKSIELEGEIAKMAF